MEHEVPVLTTTTTTATAANNDLFRKHFPAQDQLRNERAVELDAVYRRQWEAEVKAGPVQFSLLCDVELALVKHDMVHGRRPDLDVVARYGNLAMLERVLEAHGAAYEWLDVHQAWRTAHLWNCESVRKRLNALCEEKDKSRKVRDVMPGLIPSRRACVETPGLECARQWNRLSHTKILDRLEGKFELGEGENDDDNDLTIDTFVDVVTAYCDAHHIEYCNLNARVEEDDGLKNVQTKAEREEVRLIMDQCCCSVDKARATLAQCNGDVVIAITRIMTD